MKHLLSLKYLLISPKLLLNSLRRTGRRNRLLALGVLVIFLAGLVFASLRLFKETEAAWWPGDGTNVWSKRQRLTVTNNSSDSLASTTTIAVTINTSDLFSTGKLQNDCDDIRIVYDTGSVQTLLDRSLSYPDGSNCTTSTATKIFFKLQSDLGSAASTTAYYIYYDSPHASVPSNPDNAFDVGAKDALLVCPFDGTTTCAASETPSLHSALETFSFGDSCYLDFLSNYKKIGTY